MTVEMVESKTISAKLTAALAKPKELAKFFSADGPTAASDGLAERLTGLAKGWTDVNGSLTTRQDGLKKSLDLNGKRQDAMELRVAATEKRLRAQYTALDEMMGKLSSLSASVTQQMAMFNNSSKS